MARVELTKTVPPGTLVASGKKLTMAAADIVNKNKIKMRGGEIIVAHNTGVGAATVSVTSAPEAGREEDIDAVSIGAGGIMIFGPLAQAGWLQDSTGELELEASSADVDFGVIAASFEATPSFKFNLSS